MGCTAVKRGLETKKKQKPTESPVRCEGGTNPFRFGKKMDRGPRGEQRVGARNWRSSSSHRGQRPKLCFEVVGATAPSRLAASRAAWDRRGAGKQQGRIFKTPLIR